ncbi:MAG: hypothetical protein Kow0032_03950 [Methyloligellaceae bacterium]
MTLDQQQKFRHIASLALALLVVGLVGVFAFLVPVFATTLDAYSVFAFPLGFYLTAQGSIVAFVFLIFWAGGRQEWIDRKFGAAEER